MADITQIFKSTVKMLKVRHRAVSSMKGDTSPDEPNEGKPTFKLKPSIGSLGGESDKSFSANIKEIVSVSVQSMSLVPIVVTFGRRHILPSHFLCNLGGQDYGPQAFSLEKQKSLSCSVKVCAISY